MTTGKTNKTGVAHERKERSSTAKFRVWDAEQNWLITISLAILAVVALAGALIYTRTIMIPFVVALFIVALVAPIEDFQVRRLRLPRVIAITVTLLVVVSVTALASLFVAQGIRTIAYTASDYSAGFVNMANKLLTPIEYLYKLKEPPPAQQQQPGAGTPTPAPPVTPNVVPPVESKPEAFELFPLVQDADKPAVLDVRPRPNPPAPAQGAEKATLPDLRPPQVAAAPAPDANQAVARVTEPNEPAQGQARIDTRQIVEDLIANARQMIRELANHIFNLLRNTVGIIFGLLSDMLFACVFVIFLLAGRNPHAEHSQMYLDVVRQIRRYLGTKVVLSATVGVLIWASLEIIGLELAGVFGVLSFLLNFIPSIGPIIVTVLPLPLALAQFQSPLPVILVVVVPGVIHNVIGNIIEPKLMGEGLDLHPVTVLLALSFWSFLWGIVGMFLAVPITAVIRIVMMQFDTLKPIANLLAGEFSTRPKAGAAAVTPAASSHPEETAPDGSLPG